MVITRTPYRVSFLGGGTDYSPWLAENAGAVLSTSIAQSLRVSVRWLPQFFDYTYKVAWSKVETASRIEDIEHPAARAVLNYFAPRRGVEIHIEGDLPGRSGVGSSAACMVGLLRAVETLCDHPSSVPELLATRASELERSLHGNAVGFQDPIACAVGGLNLIEFQRGGRWRVEPVRAAPATLRALEDCLLLFFTGIQRDASEITRAQLDRAAQNSDALCELAALARCGRAVLEDDDVDAFGSMLDRAWRLKASLAPNVSNATIDGYYAAALTAGASGGKLLGAGGGGFLLIFAPPAAAQAVRGALRGLVEVPFRFESRGVRVIFNEEGP